MPDFRHQRPTITGNRPGPSCRGDGSGFWGFVGALNDSFSALGYIIVGIFAGAWLVSYIVYRVNGYDEIEA